MDTNFYDVIVCGAELAGLVAAALLARRGLRVLLLGHDTDRPSFDAGGVALSRGPALLPALESQPVAACSPSSTASRSCAAARRSSAPAIRWRCRASASTCWPSASRRAAS